MGRWGWVRKPPTTGSLAPRAPGPLLRGFPRVTINITKHLSVLTAGNTKGFWSFVPAKGTKTKRVSLIISRSIIPEQPLRAAMPIRALGPHGRNARGISSARSGLLRSSPALTACNPPSLGFKVCVLFRVPSIPTCHEDRSARPQTAPPAVGLIPYPTL